MLKRRFLPHQLAGWRAVKKSTALPLFWEMRLGKTILAIRWLRTRPSCSKILIACPMQVLESWKMELALEGEESRVFEAVGSSTQKLEVVHSALEADGRAWLLTNYEALTVSGRKSRENKPLATPSPIAKMPWDAITLDESTAIRNPKAQITKVALRTLSKARYKCAMSGLPNPEGEDDYVCQMLFLHDKFMDCTDYWEWRRRHMLQMPFGGWQIKRQSRKQVPIEVSKTALRLTRQQAGIGKPLIRSTRMVSLPAKQQRAIAELWTSFRVGDKLTKLSLENIGLEAAIAGGFYKGLEHDVKLRELKYLLRGELRDQPVLVWCRHTAEIDGVTAFLVDKLKLRCRAVRGSLESTAAKTKKRNAESIAAFMTGKLDALVLQPKSVSKGIDMSRADVAIVYSNWHDYEVRSQLEARTCHPQKKVSSLVIDIAARGSADSLMPSLMGEKRITAERVNDAIYAMIKERTA